MSFTIARVPITMAAPIPTLIQFFLLIIKILVNSWENRVRTCVTLINSQVPKPFSHLPKKGFYGLCREFYITKGNPSTRASREPAAFDIMKKCLWQPLSRLPYLTLFLNFTFTLLFTSHISYLLNFLQYTKNISHFQIF